MIRILLSTRLGERRMTQSALSRITGIRAATISHMYNEFFCDRISLEHLNAICKALSCDVCDILQYVPDDNSDTRKG